MGAFCFLSGDGASQLLGSRAESNSGAMFFHPACQSLRLGDGGQAEKTSELVPDIFSFMKIEVPLWDRQIPATAKIYSRAIREASAHLFNQCGIEGQKVYSRFRPLNLYL